VGHPANGSSTRPSSATIWLLYPQTVAALCRHLSLINPPVAITTASLPNWTAGIGYNQTLSAPGTSTFTGDRALPDGLP